MHEQITQQLRARRDEILRRTSETVAALIDDVADRVGDTIDIAVDEQTESTQRRLDDRFARELADIDAALRRIADGGYGRCEHCADELPPRRLELQPLARYCVDCQEELEVEAGRRYKRPGLMDEME